MFSLCSLKEYIANQIKVYTPEMSEIDYRISNMTFIKQNIPDDINKMKKIGKISISNTTVLDMNSIEGEVSLSYDMNKIESGKMKCQNSIFCIDEVFNECNSIIDGLLG